MWGQSYGGLLAALTVLESPKGSIASCLLTSPAMANELDCTLKIIKVCHTSRLATASRNPPQPAAEAVSRCTTHPPTRPQAIKLGELIAFFNPTLKMVDIVPPSGMSKSKREQVRPARSAHTRHVLCASGATLLAPISHPPARSRTAMRTTPSIARDPS